MTTGAQSGCSGQYCRLHRPWQMGHADEFPCSACKRLAFMLWHASLPLLAHLKQVVVESGVAWVLAHLQQHARQRSRAHTSHGGKGGAHKAWMGHMARVSQKVWITSKGTWLCGLVQMPAFAACMQACTRRPHADMHAPSITPSPLPAYSPCHMSKHGSMLAHAHAHILCKQP